MIVKCRQFVCNTWYGLGSIGNTFMFRLSPSFREIVNDKVSSDKHTLATTEAVVRTLQGDPLGNIVKVLQG